MVSNQVLFVPCHFTIDSNPFIYSVLPTFPLHLFFIRFISPCRSLCESVRDSCAPIMSCYGYPWPEILRCDQYPADHLMCISSITNTSVQTGARRGKKFTTWTLIIELTSFNNRFIKWFDYFSASGKLSRLWAGRGFFYKRYSGDLLQEWLWWVSIFFHLFCLVIQCTLFVNNNSAFFPVVKLRLTQLKYTPASLSQFALAAKLDVLKHGPLLGGQIRSHIELWLERDATCVRNMTRHQPRGGTFLVTGTVQAGRLVVNKAYVWQRRDKNLMAAARKWKHHRCRS